MHERHTHPMDRHHAAFAVEKEDIVDLVVSKAWNELPPLPISLQTRKLLQKRVGVH